MMNENEFISAHAISMKFFPDKPVHSDIIGLFVRLKKFGFIKFERKDPIETNGFNRTTSVYKVMMKIPHNINIKMLKIIAEEDRYFVIATLNGIIGIYTKTKNGNAIVFSTISEKDIIYFDDRLSAKICADNIKNKSNIIKNTTIACIKRS